MSGKYKFDKIKNKRTKYKENNGYQGTQEWVEPG
jgi:hypothetical protein